MNIYIATTISNTSSDKNHPELTYRGGYWESEPMLVRVKDDAIFSLHRHGAQTLDGFVFATAYAEVEYDDDDNKSMGSVTWVPVHNTARDIQLSDVDFWIDPKSIDKGMFVKRHEEFKV